MDSNIAESLKKAQDDYYSNNKKNVFFKKEQKFECAESLSQQFDIHQIIAASVFVIPDTNRVYMDYPMFKMYANPENYLLIAQRFITIINELIHKYGVYEMHLNINGFTVSAAERYIPLIRLYCQECLKDPSLSRYDKMSQLYTYYTPLVMSNIVPIIAKVSEPGLRDKMTNYSKQESGEFLKQLLNN